MHHKCVFGAEAHERFGDDAGTIGIGNPNHLPPYARGIRERSDQVHERRRAQLATHRADVFHRWMETRREQEHDTGVVEHACRSGRVEHDPKTQRLEDVRGAAARRVGTVAVLWHHAAGARGDERRDGRDVERPDRAAARAARVD